MKVSKENREFMLASCTRFMNHLFMVDDGKDLTENDVYNIWYSASINIRFSDDNLNVVFINGERLFKYDDDVEFYLDDSNDETITTACRWVAERLNKEYKRIYTNKEISRFIQDRRKF